MLQGLVNILMSKYGTGYDSRYVSSHGRFEHGQGSGGKRDFYISNHISHPELSAFNIYGIYNELII